MATIQRGDIYFINLDPVIGREQGGTRPVVVVSSNSRVNALPLVITVVIGTKGANVYKDFLTNVRVPSSESGLPLETVFMCFHIRAVDLSRFPAQPSGKLSTNALEEIDTAIRYCLEL
jgi:mRNA interferase MazF